MLQILAMAVCWLFYMGVGIWGINVRWPGASRSSTSVVDRIGHAGTLISRVAAAPPEVAHEH